MTIKRFLPILVILTLSIISILPLLRPGYFTIHDDQQVTRLYELDKTLRSGVFPVRWVADLGFGFGYALFNFYPPLVYYLGEIFHLLGVSFLDSTKIVWGIALFGSALAMYLLAKKLFGEIGGVVAAAFYLYAPYHAVDAYVRGALAELFSFVWVPLILLFGYITIEEKKMKYTIITGVFLALLMLTHNLVFLPFYGLFLVWFFAVAILKGRGAIRLNVIYFLVATIIGFSLSTFFWLPALWEKQFTLTDQFLTTGLASYKIHFVCPSQLWNSLWGYGGSVPGCLDGLSFKIGKPHILLSLAAFFLAAILYIRRTAKPTVFLILLPSFALFIFSAFMTTPFSSPIWDSLSPLWYLQFPWRFLEFTALFSSICIGTLIMMVKNKATKLFLGAFLTVGIILLYGKYFVPQAEITSATDQTLLTDQGIRGRISQTSFEYMPRGVAIVPNEFGSYTLDIKSFPTSPYSVLVGDFLANKTNVKPGNFQISGSSQKGAMIQLATTNFPGWKLQVDGNEISIDDLNKLKLITVNIPSGQHTVVARFDNTPVRTIGNLISLFAIIGLAIYLLYGSRRHQT